MHENKTYGIAVKRLRSSTKIKKHIKEAIKQIENSVGFEFIAITLDNDKSSF